MALFLLCATCKPAPQQPTTQAAGPKIRATVVTIHTTIRPANRTFPHLIVIGGDRVRSTSEKDTWRLFDLKEKTVTYVDDIARTARIEPISAAVERRHKANTATLPPHYASVRLERTNERKPIHGVQAQRMNIESGAYQREIWLAEHPAIPRGLFAMMHASETPSSPLAPMMRNVDDVLTKIDGFPLQDRAEVKYGQKNLIIERSVVGIAQRDVPETMLKVPAGYEVSDTRSERASPGLRPPSPRTRGEGPD